MWWAECGENLPGVLTKEAMQCGKREIREASSEESPDAPGGA